MKTKLLTLLTLAFIGLSTANAQVGIGTNDPENTAALDVDATDKGFLPPRMDTAERDAINGGTIAQGLVIYNTDVNCLQWYDGTDWFDPCEEPTSGGQQAPDPLPGNITLEQVATYYIASADDTDYLDGSGDLSINTTEAQLPGGTEDEADGATTETAIDIQGTLTTTGVTINIPYEVVTASTTLPAFEQTITIPAEYTQTGASAVDIKFSYPEQTSLAVGPGVVEATLEAVGTDLDVIKFDLNSGFGADFLGFLLGSFTYATDDAGNTADLEVRGIPGIPDKNFGDGVHDFLYYPVTSDGKRWLNNNLGANYANINNAAFDPAQQATGSTDANAWGNYFQWGRDSDGHEFSSSNEVSGPVAAGSENSNFILVNFSDPDWLSTQDNTRWGDPNDTDKGVHDPCPNGFRVPTNAELDAERSSWSSNTTTGAIASPLKLPAAGSRSNSTGDVIGFVTSGSYWSSAVSADEARFLSFNGTTSSMITGSRARGNSVRCIQE